MRNRILDDIANNRFAGIYLLYGEEDYLKRYYRDKLLSALVPPGDTINYNAWHGKETDVQAVMDQADTLPFFAEHRVILLQGCEVFSKGFEKLAAYIPRMPAETILLIVEDTLDKKALNSKLMKAFREKDFVPMELTRQSESDLMQWIAQMFKKNGKKVTRGAVTRLIESTLADMETLALEIDKLTAYTGPRDAVTEADVAAVTSVQTESRIFDLMDTIAARRTDDAMRMYEDLLGQKVSAVWIIDRIGAKLTDLYQIKQLRIQGFDRQAIVEKSGMRSFVVTKTLRQCNAFSLEQLRLFLQLCLDADENIKTGRMKPEEAASLLLIQVCSQG